MKIQKNASIPIPVKRTGASIINILIHSIGRIQSIIVPIPNIPPIIYPNKTTPPIIFPLPSVIFPLLSSVILYKSKIDTIIKRIPRSKLFQIMISMTDAMIKRMTSKVKYCFIGYFLKFIFNAYDQEIISTNDIQ